MEKVYSEKLILHIPAVCFLNDELKTVDASGFRTQLEADLHEIGIDGWYELQSTGHYQNLSYSQTLMVVFCSRQKARSVIMTFYKEFEQHNTELRQESFAYERNGALNIIEL